MEVHAGGGLCHGVIVGWRAPEARARRWAAPETSAPPSWAPWAALLTASLPWWLQEGITKLKKILEGDNSEVRCCRRRRRSWHAVGRLPPSPRSST